MMGLVLPKRGSRPLENGVFSLILVIFPILSGSTTAKPHPRKPTSDPLLFYRRKSFYQRERSGANPAITCIPLYRIFWSPVIWTVRSVLDAMPNEQKLLLWKSNSTEQDWIRNALHWGLRSLCINGIPFGWVWAQKKTVPGGTVVTVKKWLGRVLHTQFDAILDLSKGEVVTGSDTNSNP